MSQEIAKILALPSSFRNPRAVTLGIFDGVHLGHQKIIQALQTIDPQNGLVITFSEHPDEILWGRQVHSITTRQQKKKLLSKYGVSQIIELPFTKELSRIPAEDFAKYLFVDVFGSPHVILGYDLRFGYQAKGNFDFMNQYFGNSLKLTKINPVLYEQRPISSTRIREAILMGELDRARHMLGRDLVTSGEVIRGYQRGRQLGFPTANFETEIECVLPPFGVYAVRVSGIEGNPRAVANLGIRPTFDQVERPLIEVHIPHFEGDLYGKYLEIIWDRFIRPERRFPDKNSLVEQIKRDIKVALR